MEERLLYYREKLLRASQIAEIELENRKANDIKISGVEFESIVKDALIQLGINEENILHSSQKFPDFIINDEDGTVIGIEVKKTESNKWEVIGGSIYESLRNDIDETYLLMAKIGVNKEEKPEIKLRKYDECIQDLRVTHSPRVYLNMNLPKGEDYFTVNSANNLSELNDEELNKKIRDLLRKNKNTWYSGDNAVSYSDLSAEEKENYLNDGIALFPEVFGSDYSKFAPWMIYDCLVWCANVRDIFSAGGIVKYEDIYISAIMRRTIENISYIVTRIYNMTRMDIKRYWNIDLREEDDVIELWLGLIEDSLKFSNKLLQKNRTIVKFEDLDDEKLKLEITKKYISILRNLIEEVKTAD